MNVASALTEPRKEALLVIARRRPPMTARVSNTTDLVRGVVYWKTARWLVEQGLAEASPAFFEIWITPAGTKLAEKVLA